MLDKLNEYIVYVDGYGSDYLEFYRKANPEDALHEWGLDHGGDDHVGETIRVIDSSCGHSYEARLSFRKVK